MSRRHHTPFPPPPVWAESKILNADRRIVTLLVEGRSDLKFWSNFIHSEGCVFNLPDPTEVPHGNRNWILATLEEANNRGAPVVAIIDADFDFLEGIQHNLAGLILTDCHDLETTLIRSPAFEKLMSYAADHQKVKKVEDNSESSLRQLLLQHGRFLGLLRWANHRKGWGLVFRRQDKKGKSRDGFQYLPHDKLLREKTWDILPDGDQLTQVINFSGKDTLRGKINDILSEIRALPQANPWHLCNGHDLLGILACGLRGHLGPSKEDCRLDQLEQQLRMVAEFTHLLDTDMYQAIRRWEIDHPGYKVLKPLPSASPRA